MGFAFPTEGYVISCGIEHTFQHSALGILANNDRRMQVIGIPVAGIVCVSACGVRETQINTAMRTVGDASGNHIFIGMTDGLHIVGVAIQCKVAGDFTFPHVQRLPDVRDIGGFHSFAQFKADDAQMQTMRVRAEPVGSLFLSAGFFELAGIEFLVSTTKVECFQSFFVFQILRIGKTMPAPLTLCAQGDTFAIHLRKGLQTGSIYRKCKFAVTDTEGSQRVEFGHLGIVTGYQCFAVYRGLLLRTARRQQQGSEKGIKYFFHGILYNR